jgi:hypothetical protein
MGHRERPIRTGPLQTAPPEAGVSNRRNAVNRGNKSYLPRVLPQINRARTDKYGDALEGEEAVIALRRVRERVIADC